MRQRSNPSPRYTQPAIIKDCIFCGGRPVTWEHFFPIWLRKLIPLSGSDHATYHVVTMHITNLRTAQTAVIPRLGAFNRPGHPTSKSLKVVCKKCNSGWMSRLQTEAKPYLIQMVVNGNVELDQKGILAVSNWVAMYSMVFEYSTPDGRVLPQHVRDRFYVEQRVSEDWAMHFSLVNPPHCHGEFYQRGVRLLNQEPPRAMAVGYKYVSTITFGAGHVVFHTYTTNTEITLDSVEISSLLGFGCLYPVFTKPSGAADSALFRDLGCRVANRAIELLTR